METTAKQYEIVVSNTAEITQVLLDMEGGRYTLAILSELLQILLDKGNASGAELVVRKLHEVSEVSFEQVLSDGADIESWISLFSEALSGILEKNIF